MHLPRIVLFAFALSLGIAEAAQNTITLPLWSASQLASSATAKPERDTTTEKSELIAGRRVSRITDVSQPTMTVYPAAPANNSGVAVVVFPGGGYRILAFDLEGVEVCDWLNSVGVTCALLKYRVPDAGPFPKHSEDLADAQRAVRLVRQHAADWKVDANRVGVLGFSAGGHLAAVLSNHASETTYKAADAADQLNALPQFAILIYPGGIVHAPDLMHAGPEVIPTSSAPPTFLVQAEDDPVHVENTIVYYGLLKAAQVRAEMHVFAQGGHGYGLRSTALPVTQWPRLAVAWMHTIGMLTSTPPSATQ